MNEHDPTIDAAFLGPMAENAGLLEEWMVQAVRDYAYWRRNLHPEDKAVMGAAREFDLEYLKVKADTEDALRRLAARMKRSVPWFSPRHMGHMASDLLMPALVGRVLGTLYNPNNVSTDAAGAAVEMELEVGMDLARMFGFSTADQTAMPWGHLTSGGSVANYEALRSMEALRLYPLALVAGMRDAGLAPEHTEMTDVLGELTSWRLINVCVDDVMPLHAMAMQIALNNGGGDAVATLHKAVENQRIEAIGSVEFFRRHNVAQPVLLAPVSAHYSWAKGAKLVGLGTHQIVHIDVDERMRMDAQSLRENLERLLANKTPVLAAISVYGTTEFGTLDPVHAVVKAREEFAERGLAFGVHVDAAWGGYLVSVFRDADDSLCSPELMSERFRYFPSSEVYEATRALNQVDSITVDPHKLGFIPYPAGALVFRNREWARLQAQAAPYVFDDQTQAISDTPLALEDLGRYVLEGSKPGSSAISVAVAHDVFPLNCDGFGKIIAQTIRASEVFHDKFLAFTDEIRDVATVVMPFEPDTNIVCIALNPAGNGDLDTANRFTRNVFDSMRFSADEPAQLRDFIGSFTSFDQSRMTNEVARRFERELQLDAGTLERHPEAHVFVLRHTLMNPWLLRPINDHGKDYIDMYFEFLATQIQMQSSVCLTSTELQQ